jgi:hypothetical protein
LTDDTIKRMESGAGWAERVYPGKLDHAMREDAANNAFLEHWLLYLPAQHKRWDYYHLTLVHLREQDGVAPAIKGREQDTHEIYLRPQNPSTRPDPGDLNTIQIIGAPSAMAQFEGGDDGDACDVAALVAEQLVRRELPAEPGDTVGGLERWEQAVRLLAGEADDGS